MRLKALACFLSAALALALAGCNSVSLGGSTTHPPLSSITVTPTGRGILPGGTVTYIATGKYANGASRNITDSVTWSAAPSSVASITSAGVATGLSAGSATITATSGSISGSTVLTVNSATLTSIQVTPVGPALTTNSTDAFTATATFGDGSSEDVTASATWASSRQSIATVGSGGLVSALGAAGQTTITATFNSVSGSTAVNVVAPPATAPNLNGSYAFHFTSVDSRGAAFYVGSFTADGSGKITGGLEDANTTSGVASSVPLTGTYFVYPDGRGEIAFAKNAIYAAGVTFRFVLVNGGASGQAIEFDGNGSAQGEFELQDPSAFHDAAVNGTYVFRLNGFDPASDPAGPLGEVGLFTADGAGNVGAGVSDIIDNGVYKANSSLSGSFAVASNGRATLALTDSFGITSNFVAYVVSGTKLQLMQADAAGTSTWLAGVAEQQETGHVFDNQDLPGGFGFLLDTAPNNNTARFDVVGHLQFNGAGGIVSGVEQEITNNSGQTLITGGTYSMAANGRSVISAFVSANTRNYIGYSLSASRLFLLEQFSPLAGTGPADAQAGVLGNATLAGNYGFAGATVGQVPTGMVVWLNADGISAISGISDQVIKANPTNTLISVVAGAFYEVAVNGRTTLDLSDPLAVSGLVFYVDSSDEAKVLGAQPPLDGILLKQ